MRNRATSCRLNSPVKSVRVLVVALLLVGIVLPTQAFAWDAKLRGKLTFAAILGTIAFVTEWRLHWQDAELNAMRKTLGSRTDILRWKDGFDQMQLESYTEGRLLLRQGRLRSMHRDGQARRSRHLPKRNCPILRPFPTFCCTYATQRYLTDVR